MKGSSIRPRGPRKNQSVKGTVQRSRKGRPGIRHRKRGRLRWGIIFLCVGLSVTWIYHKADPVVSAWTTVHQVSVTGLERVQREEVLSLLSIPEGTNLFSITPGHYVEQLESHPWIATASVERILPDTVSIKIKERHVAAIARFPRGNRLLDDQGYILSSDLAERRVPVPVLIGLDQAALQHKDQEVRQRAQAGIHVAGLVSKQFRMLPTIDVTHQHNIIADLPSIRFRFGRTFKDQWQRFQALYPSIQDNMKTAPKEVDLRYSGKVILRKMG